MQARLKVQRAHAAASAAIDYWMEEIARKQAEYDAAVQEEMKKLLLKKTWCGGYKFNEVRAQKFVESPTFEYYYTYSHIRHIKYEIEALNKIHAWLVSFTMSTKDKTGFMVILTEEQYGWMWRAV